MGVTPLQHNEDSMRISTLTLCLCATLTLAACNKTDEPATPTPAPTTPTTAPATTPAAPPAATPTPAPSASSAAIGVAQCDDYLTKYEACLTGKVPESSRAALQQSLDATRAGWAQAAATPEGRAGLASACDQMISAARQSMQAYGCTDF
jgi:hypothetical protein